MSTQNAYMKGKNHDWEYVIGLEVHAQIISKSKLFSSAPTDFGTSPNSQVDYLDSAFPGMLPTLNKHCIKQAVKAGLCLNANINLVSTFDRKNYFYPDLPQGYQISQFYVPIVEKGWINIKSDNGTDKRITIARLHIEQDAGKSVHDYLEGFTCIDLNRANMPLMEIVSEPDLSSPLEAAEYIKNLRKILVYLEVCDGNMEKGSLRCDANVSVRPKGSNQMGTRCEIKNLNTIKGIIKAIEFEGRRQINIIESGKSIVSSTMTFDEKSLQTIPIRTKEESSDYRYFPEPDLPPIVISQEYVEEVRASLPELPEQKMQKYITNYGISDQDAQTLVSEKPVAQYFESLIRLNASPKIACTWVLTSVFSKLNELSIGIDEFTITPARLVKLLNLLETDVLSNKSAKKVFEEMLENDKEANVIAKEMNLLQISDPETIFNVIKKVLIKNKTLADRYCSGEKKLLNVLMADVFSETQGRANPQIVQSLLIKALESE
jgi:aspartyl-tRNA(Asn)/glutamyl-tRNA(Gln) amidotransferase subunit B